MPGGQHMDGKKDEWARNTVPIRSYVRTSGIAALIIFLAGTANAGPCCEEARRRCLDAIGPDDVCTLRDPLACIRNADRALRKLSCDQQCDETCCEITNGAQRICPTYMTRIAPGLIDLKLIGGGGGVSGDVGLTHP